MRICGYEILGLSVAVSEITASAARDQDLAADLSVVLDDQNAFSAPAGLKGTKKTGRSAADDDRVVDHLAKIAFFQDIEMVGHVAAHDVKNCTS